LAGTHLNALPRASLASLALASVADARPQTRTNTVQSSDGVAVNDAGVEKLELRVVVSESRQKIPIIPMRLCCPSWTSWL